MSFPNLGQVQDLQVRAALQQIFSWQASWQKGTSVQPPGPLTLGGQRIQQVGDPSAPQDVVTKAYGDANYGGGATALSIAEAAIPPLTVTQLIASAGAVTVGTHADRVLIDAGSTPVGRLFYETDRLHLYVVVAAGATGVQAWQPVRGTGPMRGTIDPATADEKPLDLGPNDTGLLFYATDFDRVYHWDGTAWIDAPGADPRGFVRDFHSSGHADFVPGAGWALCDGTAGVVRSTPAGGVTTFTVPDMTTANRFKRAVAGATGGVGGSATTHTHLVDPPNTTSSGPSATGSAQSGAGVTGPTDTHTHDVNIASFASGVPSGTGGDDALPPYMNLGPYIRL